MQLLEVQWGTPLYDACIDLRNRVLRIPLGISFKEKGMLQESKQLHFAALDDHMQLLGCFAIIVDDKGDWKMRQVAVEPDQQGRGVGRFMVDKLESLAAGQRVSTIYMHARKESVPFYEKLGYTTVGDLFEEVGIPHYKMSKEI